MRTLYAQLLICWLLSVFMYVFIHFIFLFTWSLASQPSEIHNSLRYDDKTQVVTFHLREEDWNELHCSSKIWISSRELTKVITCEPVSLADETVKSVQRVDPVETFGLFARQTFTVVESNEKCQVLKVKGVLYIVNLLPILDLASMGWYLRICTITTAKCNKIPKPSTSFRSQFCNKRILYTRTESRSAKWKFYKILSS